MGLSARASRGGRYQKRSKNNPPARPPTQRVRAIQHVVRITRIDSTHRAIDHPRFTLRAVDPTAQTLRARALSALMIPSAVCVAPPLRSAPRSDEEGPAGADDGLDDDSRAQHL